MKTYIYELSKNGIPFYIGKSVDIQERLKKHKQRFGFDITICNIDEVNSVSKNDWKPLEQYWITQYKAWGFKLENKNDGGNGHPASNKSKKQRQAESNARYNLKLKNKGIQRTRYTKEKQAEYWAEWKQTNSEKYKAYHQEYYLKKKNNETT